MDRLLRLHEVMRMAGLAKSTIYQYIADGAFPEPVKVGKHSVRWPESDVQDWIAAKAAGTKWEPKVALPRAATVDAVQTASATSRPKPDASADASGSAAPGAEVVSGSMIRGLMPDGQVRVLKRVSNAFVPVEGTLGASQDAARKRQERARERERGLVRVNSKVRAERAPTIKSIIHLVDSLVTLPTTPDLLETVNRAIAGNVSAPSSPALVAQANAAIAKARGDGERFGSLVGVLYACGALLLGYMAFLEMLDQLWFQRLLWDVGIL